MFVVPESDPLEFNTDVTEAEQKQDRCCLRS